MCVLYVSLGSAMGSVVLFILRSRLFKLFCLDLV